MKRIISVCLVLLFVFSLLPAPEARADGEVWDGTVDISWYDPEASEFWISTPAQLAGLAALVNGMTDPACPGIIGDEKYIKSIPCKDYLLVGAGGGDVSDVVYLSEVDFAHKTVYLTADLDMGGVYDKTSGTWSGPNWTPIGGKFPMLPEEANGDCLTLDTRFNGLLDGQGHTIRNLYCYRYAAKGFPYSMAIGIVGFLGGLGGINDDSTAVFEDGWQPGVRNLALVSGSILGRRMVGGIVGRIGDTSHGVLVENCANFASVHSTDAKGVGGIVGSAWGTGAIRGCYNAGTISTTYSSPAGGIVGTNEGMDIYCCYNVGRIDTRGQERGREIGSHDTGIYTVDNCLYLEGSGDDPRNPGYYKGASKRISVNVTGMTAEELRSEDALAVLNTDGAVFVPDTAGINGGWPVLWFQVSARESVCSVTIRQPETGGTVSASLTGEGRFGETVILSAEEETGCSLEYFTVNGERISADRFTLTGEAEVSAVFKLLRTVAITIPESRDYYVAVSREGWKLTDEGMTYVWEEMLRSGDSLVEGNLLRVLIWSYEDASPEDMDLEYVDAYISDLPGTVKNADGTYTVTGEADVEISLDRRTQQKAWINLADTDWYRRDPRKTEYVLTTPEELAGLALLVNREGIDFAGVTISLGEDISLENRDGTVGLRVWTPIGANANKSFRGTFDGKGHAVYDLVIRASSSYAGLFGCCTDAVIRDLSVYGDVESSASAAYGAGIAAYFSGGSISGCRFYGRVAVSGTHAGGIAAMIRDGAVIEDCENYGSVTGASGLGGILALSDSGEDSVLRCVNYGNIVSAGNGTYGVGGIAGRLAGKLLGCENRGDVGGTDRYIGGIAGYTTAKRASEVRDCRNTGTVTCSNDMATASLGGVVGYGQYLILAGAENLGQVVPGATFASGHTGDLVGREGAEGITAEDSAGEIPEFVPVPPRTFDREEKDTYTVSFRAQGALVGSAFYVPGAAAVTEPSVPEREDGYLGYWDNYELGEKDIQVRAVYRQRLVRGGDRITESGAWHIAWFSTGEITVASGVKAVLIGSNGGSEGFEGLTLRVEPGASLTLRDTVLNGDMTLLTFEGGNTWTLEGENRLLSRTEAENNAQPTVRVSGDLEINGQGTAYLEAGIRNTAMYLDAPDSVLTLSGGRLTVYKEDLLGFAGGALQGPDSVLRVTGGELRGHTESDNVTVVCVRKLEQTGGRILVQAARCPDAIRGEAVLTGGSISAYGHSGNSAAEVRAYPGAAAVPGLTGTAEFTPFLPFTDLFAADDCYDAVRWCYEQGLFKGTSDTTFEPEGAMTRAMFVTVLHRLAGRPAAEGENGFTDLRQDWYREAVTWAVELGITKGVSETRFSPDTPVTREQAAVFLFRYAKAAGDLDKLTASAYTGKVGSLSSWAEAEARWALGAGLLRGRESAMLTPGEAAPRSLLAVILANYAESIA
ncbi:MAG: S-layer homology domain-containing protein [Oscillospiraceae bacterium]|nr:S-layer homology domain-containing protein [Oscillospiraceae bacterium]